MRQIPSFSTRPDICVPCNEMLLNHLPGGVWVVASLTLMSYVQVDRRLVRVQIRFRPADVIALGTRVAALWDVLVLSVHVRLQVAFRCTSVLTVFTLKLTFRLNIRNNKHPENVPGTNCLHRGSSCVNLRCPCRDFWNHTCHSSTSGHCALPGNKKSERADLILIG